MQRLPDLPHDVESLTKLVIEQQAALDAAQVTLLWSQLEVEKLKIELLRLKRMQFGRSSEQLEQQIAQLELTLEDLEASSAQIPPPIPMAEQTASAKPVRRALPPGLPREVITHASPCACPECGGPLRSLGEDRGRVSGHTGQASQGAPRDGNAPSASPHSNCWRLHG